MFPASKSNVVNTQTINAKMDAGTVNNEQIFQAHGEGYKFEE